MVGKVAKSFKCYEFLDLMEITINSTSQSVIKTMYRRQRLKERISPGGKAMPCVRTKKAPGCLCRRSLPSLSLIYH